MTHIPAFLEGQSHITVMQLTKHIMKIFNQAINITPKVITKLFNMNQQQ
jgi:hypothetical protein